MQTPSDNRVSPPREESPRAPPLRPSEFWGVLVATALLLLGAWASAFVSRDLWILPLSGAIGLAIWSLQRVDERQRIARALAARGSSTDLNPDSLYLIRERYPRADRLTRGAYVGALLEGLRSVDEDTRDAAQSNLRRLRTQMSQGRARAAAEKALEIADSLAPPQRDQAVGVLRDFGSDAASPLPPDDFVRMVRLVAGSANEPEIEALATALSLLRRGAREISPEILAAARHLIERGNESESSALASLLGALLRPERAAESGEIVALLIAALGRPEARVQRAAVGAIDAGTAVIAQTAAADVAAVLGAMEFGEPYVADLAAVAQVRFVIPPTAAVVTKAREVRERAFAGLEGANAERVWECICIIGAAPFALSVDELAHIERTLQACTESADPRFRIVGLEGAKRIAAHLPFEARTRAALRAIPLMRDVDERVRYNATWSVGAHTELVDDGNRATVVDALLREADAGGDESRVLFIVAMYAMMDEADPSTKARLVKARGR